MGDTSPISTRKLCFDILKIPKDELLAVIADCESYYSPYVQSKRKKDGGIKLRRIEPSVGYLKKIQRKIDKVILKDALGDLPLGIMGGRSGFSVVDNARRHMKAGAIMKYDVSNFFPSVSDKQVYNIFRYRLNFCEEASNILKLLTTYESHLPQGAPSSTSLAILALEPTCLNLIDYCASHALEFSVWVDDITISGSKEQLETSREEIGDILRRSPFQINPDKDSGIIQKGSKVGMSVTGVFIDHHGRLTIGRKRLRDIRNSILRKRQTTERVKGRLAFLKQVNVRQSRKLIHHYRKNRQS